MTTRAMEGSRVEVRASRENTVTDRSVQSHQLLTFLLGADEYGFAIDGVREIAEFKPLTPVPMRPRWVRGVMNLRGTVVPVIDLPARFGFAPIEVTRRTCLIVVEVEVSGNSNLMAVMVDAVMRVVDVAAGEVEEAPPFGMPEDVVIGTVQLNGSMIVLLDVVEAVDARH
jgi:purine-binding chemotaxis protein CheW